MMVFYIHYTEEAVTSTEDIENQESIDNSLIISPNPFNQATNIQYELKHSAAVQVEVFDLLGNQVSVLYDEEQPAGFYSHEFAPKGDLATGLYLARLTVDGMVFSSKFSYVK